MDPVEFKAPNIVDKKAFKKKADEITFRPCTRPGENERKIGILSVLHHKLNYYSLLKSTKKYL